MWTEIRLSKQIKNLGPAKFKSTNEELSNFFSLYEICDD